MAHINYKATHRHTHTHIIGAYIIDCHSLLLVPMILILKKNQFCFVFFRICFVAIRKQKVNRNGKEAETTIKRMSNTFSVLLVMIFYCPCNHRKTPSVCHLNTSFVSKTTYFSTHDAEMHASSVFLKCHIKIKLKTNSKWYIFGM